MKPSIIFYVLKTQDRAAKDYFVCETVEKLFQTEKNIFIFTENKNETNSLNELLWTFKKESFIPHSISMDDDNVYLKVMLNHELPPKKNKFNVFINLTQEFKDSFLNSEKLIEIVYGNEERQQIFRDKYKQYKQLGYQITTEKI